MLASTTETSPEQHVDIGSRAARAWSGRQRRWGAGHTKQARNRSPSPPNVRHTGGEFSRLAGHRKRAGGNRWDRSGGELGQRSDGRKGTFLLPRFRGTSLLFPPPAAERGEGRHRPAPTESRAGPADELAKPPTACASIG